MQGFGSREDGPQQHSTHFNSQPHYQSMSYDHDKIGLIENRVLKLEFTVDGHKDELKELQNTSRNLSQSLKGIQESLQQIKWLALGASIVFFGKELGISKTLSIVLGV